jgi:hypothetical protein
MASLRSNFLAAAVLIGCASEPELEAVEAAECRPVSFRACRADACRGVQQCLESGSWSSCQCTLTDSSTPDRAGNSSTD